jgi:arsenical pump membrane protein
MHATAAAHALLCFIIAISIVLMLTRPRNIPEVYWISGGVVLLLAFRLITFRLAEGGVRKSLDVCFFLIGMMLLAELAREHGVFDWLSATAVRAAKEIGRAHV